MSASLPQISLFNMRHGDDIYLPTSASLYSCWTFYIIIQSGAIGLGVKWRKQQVLFRRLLME